MVDSGFHRDAKGLEVHVFHSFTYADAAARLAAVLTAEDVGKVALQSDTLAFYVLQNEVGPVWANLVAAGGGAIPTQDDGVLIVAAPTAHNFVGAGVVVTDVAGVATIAISGAGVAAGNDGAVQFNDAGVTAGDDRFSWDKDLRKATVHGDVEQVGGTDVDLYTPIIVSTTAVGSAPRQSVVQGNYLYICDSTSDDLRIFDVTDPAAPDPVATLAAVGAGRGIDVAGRYCYIANQNAPNELVIIDVLNKSQPVIKSRLTIGGTMRGVKVRGNVAFLTESSGTIGLTAVDVSDPANPVILDSIDVAGGLRTEFDILDNFVYVLAVTGDEFNIVDASDPANLSKVHGNTTLSGSMFCLAVQGSRCYIGDDTNDQIHVMDISDPPNTPTTPIASYSTPSASSIRALFIAGNFLYAVDAVNDWMQVYDISDPNAAPVPISTEFVIGSNPVSIAVVGRYAYVTDNTDDNFKVIDVRGIDAQNLNVGTFDAGSGNIRRNLTVAGRLAGDSALIGQGGILSDGHVVAKGRITGGLPRNFVEVYKEEDLPIAGSTIVFVQGLVYQMLAPVSSDKQLILPDAAGAFEPATLRSSNKQVNKLTSTGSGGALIIGPGSGQGQLILQNMTIEQTGARAFASLTGNAQNQMLLELDDTVVTGFDAGTQFQNCIFNVNNAAFWTGSGVFTCIDCELNMIDGFNANFVDTGLPALDIRSLDTVTNVPSLINIQNMKLSGQAGESFFVLHPNLIATSRILLAVISASPFTPGTGTFFGTVAAAITGLSNSATNPGVKTTCAASGHRYGDGDDVTLEAFATQTQYNQDYVASNVVPGVSFDVIEIFVATDTGLSSMDSIDQTDPKVTRRNCPNEKDSSTSAEAVLLANVNTTVVPAAGARVLVNGGVLWTSALSERLTVNSDGSIDHIGLEPIDIIADGNLEVEPASSTKKLSCQFLAIESASRTVTFTSASNILNETSTPRVNGDMVIFKDTAGTLPAELRTDVAYFVVTQLANSFQLSYTEGGAPIAFTDDGTPVNSYRVALLKGSMPTNTIAANSPSQLIPQALIPFDTINETVMVVSNEDDAVDIDVNQAYLRIR